MKVLVLGGSGMLGHKLWQTFAPRFDTYVTFRGDLASHAGAGIFYESRAIAQVKAEEFATVERVLSAVQPDVVVNCIGIVKQDADAKDPVTSITINSLFPHRLARVCRETNTRLIHISTDCVFSGLKGNYAETESPDADDLYGRTKLLGEVADVGCLTIRTSMVGRELRGTHGLLEWFFSQQGTQVRGFTRAVFSGLTTAALSAVIAEIVSEHRELSGLRHVAANPVNKFDLLSLVNEIYGLRVELVPDGSFVCDRSLDGSHFRSETGILAPSWSEMIEHMRADPTPYDEIRRVYGS